MEAQKQKLKRTQKEISKPEDFTDPEVLYDKLITTIREYHPSTDLSMVEKAYKLARDAHKDQKRKSGEPYIIHPLCVAIIKNASSSKMGKKDIIKIADNMDLNLDVLGYIDPDITVCYIRDGKIVEKKHLELPERIVNIVRCKNPRCITSVEQDLEQVFKLTDRENRIYRCAYCESKKSEY